MKNGSRSNALLVELLIVVMFFMLAATVLLQVFSSSSELGNKAGKTIEALNAAQNVAGHLYAAQDPEAELAAMGFTQNEETWTRDDGGYVIEAFTSVSERKGGLWYSQEVRVDLNGERLLTLPCSRYEEARP